MTKTADELACKTVALVGAQSAGKTTSLLYATYRLKSVSRNVGILNEIARTYRDPSKLSDRGDFETQWWIMQEQILQESNLRGYYRHVLCDRSIYDTIPYVRTLQYAGRISQPRAEFMVRTAYTWAELNPYTAIIYLEPLRFENDSMRVGGSGLQSTIDIQMRAVVREVEQKGTKVYWVNMQPKKQRCKEVYRIIQEIFGFKDGEDIDE